MLLIRSLRIYSFDWILCFNRVNTFIFIVIVSVSSIHGGQPYQYTNAQKLVALPAYHQQTQAYKTIVAPTPSTTASSYTAAYVQPTAISPIKVRNMQSNLIIFCAAVCTTLLSNKCYLTQSSSFFLYFHFILFVSTFRKHNKITMDPLQLHMHKNWPPTLHRILLVPRLQRHKPHIIRRTINNRTQVIKDLPSIICHKHPIQMQPFILDRSNCIRHHHSANTATLRLRHRKNISMHRNRFATTPSSISINE